MGIVAVAASVQAKEQDDWTAGQRRQQQRPSGKEGVLTEEPALHRPFTGNNPVAQYPDHETLRDAFLHFQQSVRSAVNGNDGFSQRRIQGAEVAGHALIVCGVHQYLDRKMVCSHADRPQRFKAAQMRTQQDAALPGCGLIQNQLLIEETDFKPIQPPGEKIHPIQNRSGETVNMAEHLAQAWRPTQHPPQIAL